MTNRNEAKMQTVHLGEDGLLPFLQNLYLGAGVEGAAKAAGCAVTTADGVTNLMASIDDNKNYVVPGATLRGVFAILASAADGMEAAMKCVSLEQERTEHLRAYIDDLLTFPERYAAERTDILKEAA